MLFAICDALAYVAPKSLTGIAGELEAVKSAVYGIVGALRPLQQHRLRALLRGVYKTLVMPTAPRSGRGVGSDQLGVAEPGDWDVWRALVLIARLVPGALRPADRMPCFTVPTNGALALRVVEDWVASAVSTRSASSLGTLYCGAWHEALDTVRVHMKAKSLALADYQRNCVDYMHKADDEAQTKGHLIALDVGLGKTATAAFYLAERLLKRGGAKHILWFTESSSISGTGAATAHANQLQDTWGFCGVVHVRSADTDPTRTLESIEAGDQRRLDEGVERGTRARKRDLRNRLGHPQCAIGGDGTAERLGQADAQRASGCAEETNHGGWFIAAAKKSALCRARRPHSPLSYFPTTISVPLTSFAPSAQA